jgi:hypothetical protein
LTPSARGYKGRGYASGPAGVFRIPEMAKVGDVDGMRAVIEDIAKSMQDYWQTTMGRVYLRLAAINGVIKDKLGIVRYLCGERGVPGLADDPEAYGAFPAVASLPSSFLLSLCRGFFFISLTTGISIPYALPSLISVSHSPHLPLPQR